MASVFITYGSTTGNTEYVAESIQRTFEQSGHSVTVEDVADISASDLTKTFDLYCLGCSTWGDDEIELQDDFIPVYEDIEGLDLNGKQIACFGCGDSSYTYFCGAVDAIEAACKTAGAAPVIESLKIDGDPKAEQGDIDAWANELLSKING
ncbi:MAG: flavodoxin [Desulfovibrionales bacterium]|nr:flavodoxin [Desulfovibrionales bacterium]